MTEGTLYSFDSARIGPEETYVSPRLSPGKKRTRLLSGGANAAKPEKTVSFIGRSGRSYVAQPTSLENLRIRDDQLCVLSVRNQNGEAVLWVGSGQSLVHDQPNRAEFLEVVNTADKAYIIDIGDLAAQSLASWDLTRTQHELPRAA